MSLPCGKSGSGALSASRSARQTPTSGTSFSPKPARARLSAPRKPARSFPLGSARTTTTTSFNRSLQIAPTVPRKGRERIGAGTRGTRHLFDMCRRATLTCLAHSSFAVKQTSSPGRINLIDHEIDNHSGDRHVEPQRQRPARNKTMLIKSLEPSAAQRHGNQGHNGCCQDRMRSQQREVRGSNPALPLKQDCFSHANVISQVGNQEKRRYPYRRQHEDFVYVLFSCAYCGVAAGQQDSAEPVQASIQRCIGNHGLTTFLMRSSSTSDPSRVLGHAPLPTCRNHVPAASSNLARLDHRGSLS